MTAVQLECVPSCSAVGEPLRMAGMCVTTGVRSMDARQGSGGLEWDRVGRWVATLAVAAGAIALAVHGFGRGIDGETVIAWVRSSGGWGVLAYLLAFSLLQPVGLSGHLFVLAAAILWPPWLAFALALAGSLGTSVVAFGFARYVAFDWVQRRLPARVRRYERWIMEAGLRGIIVVRLITFTMHPVQFLMGVVRVPFGAMVLGTVIGFAPTVAVDVFLGGELLARLFEWAGP